MDYLKRSLDIEESMTPFEKSIKASFFEKSNIMRVFGSAQRHVNANITYSTVVDSMHSQFTEALGGNGSVEVSSLNQATIDKLSDSHKKHLVAVEHARKIGFENNKIPEKMLPRPSFNLQSEEESIGISTQILFR